jgi:hypothetical protein
MSGRIEKYIKLYRALKLPEAAIEIARGEWESERMEVAVWRAFPPAFLPLFDDWGEGYGYWKHWTPARRMTLVKHRGIRSVRLSVVEMHTQPDPTRVYELLVTEVACNLEQLFRILLLHWFCHEPGNWTDELRRFASRAGLGEDDISWIERVSKTDYRPTAFRDHPLFLNQPPISCFKDDLEAYPGDFPHPKATLSTEKLRQMCTYEIHSSFMYAPCDSEEPDIRATIADQPDAPPWFRTTDQKDVFDELLDAGNLSGAWFCLNSFAWTAANAVRGLEQLGAAAKNKTFDLLVEAYSALDHDEDDGY